MKTFNRDGKINFVDDNNVFVGFDYESSCCEDFGYFFSRAVPTSLNDGSLDLDTDGYQFDTSFFEEVSSGWSYDSGGMAVFRLTKGEEQLFLTLYNIHNGWYSHGFDMGTGSKTIRSGSI